MQVEPRPVPSMDGAADPLARYGLFRTVLIIAASCVIVIAMKLAASFLVEIVLGLWIAMLCLPIMDWMRRRGLPRWATVAIPIATVVLCAVVVVFFVVGWIAELSDQLPTYQEQISARRADLNAWLDDHGISVPSDAVDGQISADAIVSLLQKVLPTTLDAITGLAFAFLLFAFSLLESDAAKRRLNYALGPASPHLARLREYVDVVAQAMLLRAVLGLGAAVGDGILLAILGVPHVGLWVVVSFVCSFIPYLGYWLAMVPPLLVALATQGAGAAVVVFFGYWLINGFFDSIIGPRFQGNRLNLSPVLTIIAVLFWGAMFGAVGGMIALPLTLGIKLLLLDAFPESRWLSTVIEADAPRETVVGTERPALAE
ncbi:MAG TPA: AI-2E family transporter [Thermomicrobiales bacterium]